MTHHRDTARAVLNGQFDVPLHHYSKLDWIDAAQWWADCRDEPEDEAQALDHIAVMFRVSDLATRWDWLSEREQERWGDFPSYCQAQGVEGFIPVARPVDVTDASRFPNIAAAREYARTLAA